VELGFQTERGTLAIDLPNAEPPQALQLVDRLGRQAGGREPGIHLNVATNAYRDIFLERLFVQGPDQQRFELNGVPASTRIADISGVTISQYDDQMWPHEKTGQSRPAVVDQQLPNGFRRLNPGETLEQSQIRNGDTLFVAPETQAGGPAPPKIAGELVAFLCHSSQDKPAVRQLYRRLQASGVLPWLDEENLLPGQNWRLELQLAIRKCHVVIVCLSRNSVSKSPHVRDELTLALDLLDKKPDRSIFLIPVKLEECDVPDRLADLHYVNLFEIGGYERLLRALSAKASELTTQPASPPAKSRKPRRTRPSKVANAGSSLSRKSTITVLFVAANPTDTEVLRIGREYESIRERMGRPNWSVQIDLRSVWAMEPARLLEAIQREKPTVVHFCGHGEQGGAIALEGSQGAKVLISAQSLGGIFRAINRPRVKKRIRCVFLNACHSGAAADAIGESVDAFIGTAAPIADDAAIGFATEFYAGLADGYSLKEAVELGKAQMALLAPEGSSTQDRSVGDLPTNPYDPGLVVVRGANLDQLFLARSSPQK
jgi:hypothetical protein